MTTPNITLEEFRKARYEALMSIGVALEEFRRITGTAIISIQLENNISSPTFAQTPRVTAQRVTVECEQL